MTAEKLRLRLFFVLSLVAIPSLLMVDMQNLDPTFICYLSISLAAALCGIIWTRWIWISAGKNSPIYTALAILFWGIAYQFACNSYVRWEFLIGCEMTRLTEYYRSNWWQYRSVPTELAMLYVLAYSVARMIYGKDTGENGDYQ